MENKQKQSKKKLIFRITVSLVILYILSGLWGRKSILMGKEINISKDISTGILYNNKIYFLCDYELKEPGWYLYVIFVPGKQRYKAVHLYSFNLKTGKLNQITEIRAYFNKNFTKWEREGSSIFFTTQGAWDKKTKKQMYHIFEYNTEKDEIKKHNKGDSTTIYNRFFADKKSFQGKDKIKLSRILFYTGVLPEKEWGLPEAADYSGMNKKDFKKVIIESRGSRDFRESVFRKIRDDLSSDEIFDMISAMKKFHSKRKGLKKMKKDLMAAQWISRLYIEAEYGKKPYHNEKNESIHRAVYWKDREGLTRLLAGGINPGTRDSAGLTPLMIAAYVNDASILELLLLKGTDINASDDKGCTPLVYSVFGRSHLTMKTLLQKGAARSIEGKPASSAWLYVSLTRLKRWYLEYEK